MRAIVTEGFGGPEVLTMAEVPDAAAGPGEVLIAVAASGINRADLLQREGHYPPPAGITDIIGLEVSGNIAAVGSDVEGWTVGDRCVALLAGGGYAELVAVPAGQVVHPPRGHRPDHRRRADRGGCHGCVEPYPGGHRSR